MLEWKRKNNGLMYIRFGFGNGLNWTCFQACVLTATHIQYIN